MNAALELLRTTVTFIPDQNSQHKGKWREDDPYCLTTILEPRPRFNEWEYKKILEEGVRPLSETIPYQSAQILVDATTSMIDLKFYPDQLENAGNNDLSEIWCHRVNEPTNDHPDSDENLVHALTFACEKVYEQDPASVSALDQVLRNQRWYVFTRIRQHLYVKHINDQTKPWIREIILAQDNYDRAIHPYEFQRMLRIACERLGADLLSESERKQIFDDILRGPSKNDFRNRMEDDFTEESFKKHERHFHKMQLRPFYPVLLENFTDYYQKLQTEDDKTITDNDYDLYWSENAERVYFRSPVSVDELAEMSDEKLLSFLNEWEDDHLDPEDWFTEITFEQLALTFQSVFTDQILPDETRLRFWLNNREKIARPIYVRTIVSAFSHHVKLGHFDKLDDWFEFCAWVISHPEHPKEKDISRSDESREYPDWHRARRTVRDFIGMCLEKDTDVPISKRQKLAELLDKLCTEYDRRLDEDERTLLNEYDPVIEAVNNTRSLALEDLVNFGFWVRRQLNDNHSDIHEVFEIIEKRFDIEQYCKLKLPEYALLGKKYRLIFILDREWAINHKNNFFSRDDKEIWKITFGSFIKFSIPAPEMFDVLRDDMNFALEIIDQLGAGKDIRNNVTDKLGHFLFHYYLMGKYPLKGQESLLARFYDVTKKQKKHWARLFNHVGRYLSNREEQLEISDEKKIIEYFNWRIETRELSELKRYTFWLEANCLDAEWRLRSYLKIINICGSKNNEINAQIYVMKKMIDDNLPLVMECLVKLTDLIVKDNSAGNIHINYIKPILRAGLHCDNDIVHTNAQRSYDNLLKCGYLSITDYME